MKDKILLLEDDAGLNATLLERLTSEGYKTDLACSKSEAEDLFKRSESAEGYDLLLLDVGLPDGSGLDFARDVRMRSPVPIVFLSALNSAAHRLEGFEIGAEDYIPKPFHLKELLLRIRKALSHKDITGRRKFSDFDLDFDSRAIVVKGSEAVYPTAKDFDVLKYLVEASPRVVSRQELLKGVWLESEDSQTGRTIDNSIVRLRQIFRQAKIKDDTELIRSVRGIGYQWTRG